MEMKCRASPGPWPGVLAGGSGPRRRAVGYHRQAMTQSEDAAGPGFMISIVIPVYGVAGYLDECLDSVLGQPYQQIEVIAVDDHSPDDCPAILDRRASRDSRLRVLHLNASGGPGRARNTGLAQATGDYVWFVDADDALAAGALAAVAERLAGQRPDVLLFGHEEVYPAGSTRPDPGAALLREAAATLPGTFRLADRPELINLTMTCWSKAFRLAFLRELGVPFGDGIHEDVPVSCAALLSAERISVLDRVCYRYRRGRRTSLTTPTSDAHFSIFASYQQVFDFIAERSGATATRQAGLGLVITDAVRCAVFERAIWHYTVILATGGIGIGPVGVAGLVPRSARREFFRRMSADFGRLRPAGYQFPGGARGAKLRLVERDAYWTYSFLEPVNRLRVAVRRAVLRLSSRAGRLPRTPARG